MAKYEVDFRDAAAVIRKTLVRSLLVALVIVIAGGGLAALSGGSAGLATLAFAMGAGAALVCEAYLDYERARAVYRAAAGTIEVKVRADAIEFATPASNTLIRRTPMTRVVESGNTFLVSTGKWSQPTLVPARHLSVEETALLREWARFPEPSQR